MSTQLSFDVTFVYPDRADGITVPTGLSFGWLRHLRLAIIDYESKIFLSQHS
jgi:hypothetical protein